MIKGNTKKSNIISICLFILIFGCLLTLASIYDLQVSKILVDLEQGNYFTKNTFGMVLETFGMTPGYLFLAIALSIFFANATKCDNKFIKIAGSIGFNIGTIIPMYIYASDTLGYIKRFTDVEEFVNSPLSIATSLVFAVMVGEALCFGMNNLSKEKARALLKFSLVIICTYVVSTLVINGIKNVMYRPRYRTMWFLGDTEFTNFHRWFQKSDKPIIPEALQIINGHKVGLDGFRSFPSGHTSTAGTVYTLLALPKLFKKYDNTLSKVLFVVFTVAYTGMVAVSRIVCGAHFFSDVLIGGTVAFLIAILFIKIFINNKTEKI